MSEAAPEPQYLRTAKALGWEPESQSGYDYCGSCPFCEKEGHFYFSGKSGLWSCKSGDCGLKGNIYTFLTRWTDLHQDYKSADAKLRLRRLSRERGIPVKALQKAGLLWSGKWWAIPVYAANGNSVVNLRIYRMGQKLKSLPGLDLAIWNVSALKSANPDEPVYNCEGEWDGIALQHILDKAEQPGAVVAIPGAQAFKEKWANFYIRRKVVNCFDAGKAGSEGNEYVRSRLKGVAKSFETIAWPEQAPEGFDIRDFLNNEGDFEAFEKLISREKLITRPALPASAPKKRRSRSSPRSTRSRSEDNSEQGDIFSPEDEPSPSQVFESFQLLSSGKRTPFAEVLQTYDSFLEMTKDMQDALRVAFAVIISNQLDGDPLWVHIAAPPGHGKTEILMSCAESDQCVTRSTLTPHLLVSGFPLPGGRDPSLIPQLLGKTFILKDFTEILETPKAYKDEIYSILRGAYDGRVEKSFGNGINRDYRGHFTMLSGVTNRIFAEQGAALGERFLIFAYGAESEEVSDKVVMSALKGQGDELKMRSALCQAAKSFLEYRIASDQVPEVPESYLKKIVSLSQLVSMLRATVDRDISRMRVLYRPNYEMGTRLAKQLKKLLLGLAMQNDPPEVRIEDYRIVMRAAVTSCIGWNLDALRSLAKKEGQTYFQLASSAHVPDGTMREQLEDLVLLGVLSKEYADNPAGRGAPVATYWMTDTVKRHWKAAGLPVKRPIGTSIGTPGLRYPRRRKSDAKQAAGG